MDGDRVGGLVWGWKGSERRYREGMGKGKLQELMKKDRRFSMRVDQVCGIHHNEQSSVLFDRCQTW